MLNETLRHACSCMIKCDIGYGWMWMWMCVQARKPFMLRAKTPNDKFKRKFKKKKADMPPAYLPF